MLVLPFGAPDPGGRGGRGDHAIGARLRGLTEARRLVPSLALDGRMGADHRARATAAPGSDAAIEPSLAVFAGLGITIVVTGAD